MKKAAWLVCLALAACKSKQEEAPAPVEAKKAALVAEPADVIYAASAHLRIVDAKAGRVVKGIDLQKAVRAVTFTRDGTRAFVAASDGVREIDTEKQEVTAKLTDHPARHVELSEDGRRLYVLEHEVIVHPDQTREIKPYRLLTFDVAKREMIANEEIGQRVLYAHPPEKDRFGVVVFESGEIRKIAPGRKLGSEGETIDPFFGQPSKYRARVREGSLVHAGRAYLPIEAQPSRVLEIDLAKGEASAILLDRPYSLRGLAFPSDDRMLLNAGLFLLSIDMETRALSAGVELGAAHTGLSVSSDGRFAYLAQTIDGTGGAVAIVSLDPAMEVAKKIHLDDISPWALAVRPRPALATR